MKKILMSVLAMGAITMNVNAGDCTTNRCTHVKITEVYATFGGTLYVQTSGDESTLNCTSLANRYVSVGATDPGKNALYSMMLTAQTTGKDVTIRVQEGSAGCRIFYAHMNN